MITKPSENGENYQDPEIIMDEDNIFDNEGEQDFAEYAWMESEQEFDENELRRLEEEEWIEECMEAMIEDELLADLEIWMQRARHAGTGDTSAESVLSNSHVQRSVLNPYAAEFVPRNMIDADESKIVDIE